MKKSANSLLEVKNLNLRTQNEPYKSAQNSLVKDLNFTVCEHDFFVIMGRSGVGKTTLLKAILGFHSQYTGSIQKFYEPSDANLVFQEGNLLPWLSAYENIFLPFKLSNKTPKTHFIDQLIQKLNLELIIEQLPHQLSGGQKMRTSIVRALSTGSRILFLDEPFSALDEFTREELLTLLTKLKHEYNLTIVMITHSSFEAASVGDHILVLKDKDSVLLTSPRNPTEANTQYLKSAEFLSFQQEIKFHMNWTKAKI